MLNRGVDFIQLVRRAKLAIIMRDRGSVFSLTGVVCVSEDAGACRASDLANP